MNKLIFILIFSSNLMAIENGTSEFAEENGSDEQLKFRTFDSPEECREVCKHHKHRGKTCYKLKSKSAGKFEEYRCLHEDEKRDWSLRNPLTL